MESAEAVAKVEQWLSEAYGSDSGLRVDREHVVRTPEGWSVPYNNAEFLATGEIRKAIFPLPRLVVTEPAGELRFGGPYPGQLSQPVAAPGRPYWTELLDPEYERAGFDRLGVPLPVIGGWREHAADDSETGTERPNPDYRPSPLRLGYSRPGNRLETLLAFHTAGWLDHEKLLAGLVECDGYLPRAADGQAAAAGTWDRKRNVVQVYTATRWLPRTSGFLRYDLVSLVDALKPAPRVVFNGPPDLRVVVEGSELLAVAARFPRAEAKIDEAADLPEASAEIVALARDTAAALGLSEPVRTPLPAAADARTRGFELTVEECRKVVLGQTWQLRNRLLPGTEWPADPAANGLVPGRDGWRPDSFGKYSDLAGTGYGIGWHRVVGAYAGFALGEAVATGFAVERPLTARLTEVTEALIRADLEPGGSYVDDVADLTAALGALVPAGDPADGALGLIGALPAVLTLINRGGGVPYDASGPAVRAMAARLGATGEIDQLIAVYLGLLFERLLENEFAVPGSRGSDYPPVWVASHDVLQKRQGPDWELIRGLAETSLIGLKPTGLPELKAPEEIGDGRRTASVLGRALAAVSGFENYPEQALTRAVTGSGGNPLVVALAGALIGARTGIPGLPAGQLARLDTRYVIEDLATDAVRKIDQNPGRTGLPGTRERWLRTHPPVPGGRLAARLLAERVRGCLLGGAIGDALGAPVEFLTGNQIIGKHGPEGVTGFVENPDGTGRITDDTQMTLFTAEGLIRAHAQARRTGSADVRLSLQLAYQRWLATQGQPWERVRGPQLNTRAPDGWLFGNEGLHHRRAPGATCFASLENYGRTGEVGTFEHRLNDSKGCGGVMRAAPVALWSADPAEVFRLAAVSAAITHSHPSGYLSAGALAVIVRGLLDGAGLPAAIDTARTRLLDWPDHQEQLALLDAAVALAAEGDPTPEKVERLGSGFVGESALAIAVYAALVTENPEKALLISVNHSGDSDSTGAVCGNIVGARFGDVWHRWQHKIDLTAVIEQVADDLVAEFGGHPPTGPEWRERYPSDEPEPLWPTE